MNIFEEEENLYSNFPFRENSGYLPFGTNSYIPTDGTYILYFASLSISIFPTNNENFVSIY